MRSGGWPAGASPAARGANPPPPPFLAQQQGARVLGGDEPALSARETDRLADVVEPFHLFVHAADGLDLAALVHRSGDGNPLVDRRAGQFTEKRIQLGGGSGVTLHLVITLLEGEE